MTNPFSLAGKTALITGGGSGLGLGLARCLSGRERVGPVSILVNNAGVHVKKPVLATTPAECGAVWQTHVAAAFALTRAVLPDMMARRHGSILFTASMASMFGIPLVSACAAAPASCACWRPRHPTTV